MSGSNQMKMMIAALAVSCGLEALPFKTFPEKPKEEAPEFSAEELAELRALPKQQRKQRVKELREKYAKIKP